MSRSKRPSRVRSLLRLTGVAGLACVGLSPLAADANEGHADKNHKVIFSSTTQFDYWVNTGTCRVARVEKGDGRRLAMTNTHKITENSTIDAASCRSGQDDCFVTRSASGTVSRSNGGSVLGGRNVDGFIKDSVGQCSTFMMTDNDQLEFDWKGSSNSDVSLASTARKLSDVRSKSEEFVGQRKQSPNGGWTDTRRITKPSNWQVGEAVGLCRVRFYGADYFGTIRPASHAGGDTYYWSSSQHRYRVSSNVGSGDRCHVRTGPGDESKNVQFKQFDVVSTPNSRRWSLSTSGIPSDAMVAGFHRSNPVYVCRVMREEVFWNTTTGVRTTTRTPHLGWQRHGTDECFAPEPSTNPGESRVDTRILRPGI